MTNGSGWAGLDLGTTMANRLLIVAWPNGDEIMSSFREATYVALRIYECNSR